MSLSWLVGRARTTYHHSPSPVQLRTKAGQDTSLLDLCKETIPPCQLNPLLFNGHLQTAWTTIKGRDIPIVYKRKIFEADDPAYAGTFAVDFVSHAPADEADPTLPPRTTYYTDDEFEKIGSLDSRPMLVSLHGLSGGSHEIYLRHVLEPLVSEEGGWEACVVNSRGCAMSKITTAVLYNARATWDVRQAVKWLRKTFPNRPLFGIGYSLGANILTNYVGEEGPDCQLKAAVICSNPWNLEVSSLGLQRTWLGLNVYSKVMGNSMKRLFAQHEEQITKNPRIDADAVRNITYLHEFDRAVQGPTWGYPTETAYYRDASSSDSLLAAKIPLLAINAEDDPISVREAIPFQEFTQNPYAVLCATSLGGHLSWFEVGGGRWFARAASAFLAELANKIDFEATASEQAKLHASLASSSKKPGEPVYDPMRRKLYNPA